MTTTAPGRRTVGIVVVIAVAVAAAAFWALRADADDARIPASVIDADTRMGGVELAVADVDAMRSFYTSSLGLEVLSESDGAVALGADGQEIIRLVAADGPSTSPADAGLYHAAILYPDGPALARALVGMFSTAGHLYGGSADHAVSEAFYFSDPEGNGLELYIDTPRQDWVWDDGQVQMGSAPLDPNAFISEHLYGTTSGEVTTGHVHLKVGDLDAARDFYVDLLGFAVTAESDGALFMAAGGYHHHLAVNTWTSAGAGERPATLGLGSFTVMVPAQADIQDAAARLDAAGYEYMTVDGGLVLDDPWGTTVRLRTEG
ncbi:VOC family protein [Georgenia subflava]|uniref:VOC family protein n=1 Tax=Georgenia subflava TaxID=1622177 RepID=A0A6N7EI29_9MICO|nr:VOC family protein [Georgenia subflava]MPV36763.1 VOC family protein [Georgenia subflava]